jgi:hypothetical protein
MKGMLLLVTFFYGTRTIQTCRYSRLVIINTTGVNEQKQQTITNEKNNTSQQANSTINTTTNEFWIIITRTFDSKNTDNKI